MEWAFVHSAEINRYISERRVGVRLYPVGQVVCVRLKCTKQRFRWCLGVILDNPGFGHRSNTRVVSVHWEEDVSRVSMGTPESIGWFGSEPHLHDPVRLLIARTSARTFLQAFAHGQVLSQRRRYQVRLSNICPADPHVLFREIFECT